MTRAGNLATADTRCRSGFLCCNCKIDPCLQRNHAIRGAAKREDCSRLGLGLCEVAKPGFENGKNSSVPYEVSITEGVDFYY